MLQEKNTTGIFLSLYANSEYDKYHAIKQSLTISLKSITIICFSPFRECYR